MMDNELFYVQDTRQIIGNAVLWWAKDGHGYTCDITKAHVFTKLEAEKRCTDFDGFRRHFLMWPKDYVDGATMSIVDCSHMSEKKAGVTHLPERPTPKKKPEKCCECGAFVSSDPSYWRYRDGYECKKCETSLLS